MIISASRRTDIPSYYGQWFVNALHRGHIFVPSPYNAKQYSKVNLRREAVDCIVFWTKNPLPFLSYLPHIDALDYPYYFQFTITPYNRSVERNLPDKIKLIRAFQQLSRALGSHRMVWRYDPIILDATFTVQYHEQAFQSMASMLSGYTDRCIISFVDVYKNMQRRLGKNIHMALSNAQIYDIAEKLSCIAHKNKIRLLTCAEEVDVSCYGIEHASCIDKKMIEKIVGCTIDVHRDKNQRSACGCMESIEIGTYNCCANGCSYCYALSSEETSAQNMRLHIPHSPVLIGSLPSDATIIARDTRSVRTGQGSLLL